METVAAAALGALLVASAVLLNTRFRLGGVLAGLPPPSTRARPWLAALVAYALGGLGIAVYFRTTADLLVGILFLLPLGAASSSGPGEDATLAWWYWLFAAAAALYALLRAEGANRRLDAA